MSYPPEVYIDGQLYLPAQDHDFVVGDRVRFRVENRIGPAGGTVIEVVGQRIWVDEGVTKVEDGFPVGGIEIEPCFWMPDDLEKVC